MVLLYSFMKIHRIAPLECSWQCFLTQCLSVLRKFRPSLLLEFMWNLCDQFLVQEAGMMRENFYFMYKAWFCNAVLFCIMACRVVVYCIVLCCIVLFGIVMFSMALYCFLWREKNQHFFAWCFCLFVCLFCVCVCGKGTFQPWFKLHLKVSCQKTMF